MEDSELYHCIECGEKIKIEGKPCPECGFQTDYLESIDSNYEKSFEKDTFLSHTQLSYISSTIFLIFSIELLIQLSVISFIPLIAGFITLPKIKQIFEKKTDITYPRVVSWVISSFTITSVLIFTI